MKIISKYTDYYDYLVDKYGEDPKLIFDRTDIDFKFNPSLYNNGTIFKLILANKEYHGFYYNAKIFWPNEIQQLVTIKKAKKDNHWTLPKHHNDSDCILFDVNELFNSNNKRYISLINGRKVICDSVSQLSIELPRYDSYKKQYINSYITTNGIYIPILRDIYFHNCLTAEECWVEISNYLSNKISEKESKIVSTSNNIKIQSAGFDLKTSFRPKIKKNN